ncbi:MAG: 7-carboxy-7-deazaguanine synthase, partial [Sphingomonas sp.]
DGLGGGKFANAETLAAAVEGFWGEGAADRFVVLTGGEPMLQIDDAIVDSLHARGFSIAMESNGTIAAHPGIDWVCVSPKAGSIVVQRTGDELKLVWPQPGTDIADVETWDFAHRLLQPLDDRRADANREACVAMVMQRPAWRLSLQTHKLLGLR